MREMAVHKLNQHNKKSLANSSMLSSLKNTTKKPYDPYSEDYKNVYEPNVRSNSISVYDSPQRLQDNPRLISKMKPSNMQSMKDFNEVNSIISDVRNDASVSIIVDNGTQVFNEIGRSKSREQKRVQNGTH